MTIDAICDLLASRRVPLTSERATQDAIAEVLASAGLAFTREHSLGGFGRIDFLLGNIGLEVKVAHISSPREIHRQLVRYARSPEIAHLVLATGRSVQLGEIGKPHRVVSLGRAWL